MTSHFLFPVIIAIAVIAASTTTHASLRPAYEVGGLLFRMRADDSILEVAGAAAGSDFGVVCGFARLQATEPKVADTLCRSIGYATGTFAASTTTTPPTPTTTSSTTNATNATITSTTAAATNATWNLAKITNITCPTDAGDFSQNCTFRTLATPTPCLDDAVRLSCAYGVSRGKTFRLSPALRLEVAEEVAAPFEFYPVCSAHADMLTHLKAELLCRDVFRFPSAKNATLFVTRTGAHHGDAMHGFVSCASDAVHFDECSFMHNKCTLDALGVDCLGNKGHHDSDDDGRNSNGGFTPVPRRYRRYNVVQVSVRDGSVEGKIFGSVGAVLLLCCCCVGYRFFSRRRRELRTQRSLVEALHMRRRMEEAAARDGARANLNSHTNFIPLLAGGGDHDDVMLQPIIVMPGGAGGMTAVGLGGTPPRRHHRDAVGRALSERGILATGSPTGRGRPRAEVTGAAVGDVPLSPPIGYSPPARARPSHDDDDDGGGGFPRALPATASAEIEGALFEDAPTDSATAAVEDDDDNFLPPVSASATMTTTTQHRVSESDDEDAGQRATTTSAFSLSSMC